MEDIEEHGRGDSPGGALGRDSTMWKNARDEEEPAPLTHEMPCPRCGHPPHLFLACGGGCDCQPEEMPGERLTG